MKEIDNTQKSRGTYNSSSNPVLPQIKEFNFCVGDKLYILCSQEALGTKYFEFELVQKNDCFFTVRRPYLHTKELYKVESFLIKDYEMGLLQIKEMGEILNEESRL